MSSSRRLSVIVPVRNSTDTLARALAGILSSELPRDDYEVIVVDDASSDGSSELAARYADTVVRLTGRTSGPAYARNRGSELAQGEVLVFIDPDTLVRPDTLPRMLATLAEHPTLDAISASHDGAPAARNLASQYWNLLRRFGEQRQTGTSGDVASPCAAIRRNVFYAAGMFDEWRFGTAPLEGIELGERLEDSGRNVLSSRCLEVTRLKQSNARSLCREVWNRSILLARSLGYHRTLAAVPGEVAFTLSRTGAPAFAIACAFALSAAFLRRPNLPVLITIFLLGMLALDLQAYLFFVRERGVRFAIGAAPLHLLLQGTSALGLCAGWLLRDTFGDRAPDAAMQAYAEVGLETWPPVPRAGAG
ncbi:MAG: hypothetical protein DMD72_08885 [Gemmatimonadetes bacterium]|nr:MAG: hypothetical protein DMD72_08885 [Gemmatimonadota bacterium]PYO80131.1 MAG: hypothetical protein DMD63_02090 [Gemmatimonadota bacterium]